MFRSLRNLAPALVLGFTIKNNVYGALAARALGVPFIPTITGLGTAFLSGPALQLVAETLYRGAFARAPVVVFQNEDDRSLFVSRRLVADRQAQIVPGSGVDLGRFAPRPAPAPKAGVTFLLIARVLRDKGVMEFAEAARRIRADRPDVCFELLGPLGVENRSAIDPAVVAAWVNAGVLSYHGGVEDVRPYIASADCVVLPSYREGMPRSLLEAAAMGRPVIASDVPGCRGVVDDQVTGLLCRARDAESLRIAMLDFLAMPPAQRDAMGLAGRAKMEREFDASLVVSAYRNVIEHIRIKKLL